MIILTTVSKSFYGDVLGSMRYLAKKNPGKYRLSIERLKIVFEEKTEDGYKVIEEINVSYGEL